MPAGQTNLDGVHTEVKDKSSFTVAGLRHEDMASVTYAAPYSDTLGTGHQKPYEGMTGTYGCVHIYPVHF